MPGKESLQDVFANALDTALREKLNGVETQEDLNEALQSIDVTSLFIQFLDKTSEGIFHSMKTTMFEEVMKFRADEQEFIAHQEQKWFRAFAASDAMYIMTLEAAETYSEYVQKLNEEERVPHAWTYLALQHIHGRAMQEFLEIVTLMKNGFADGAYARWRSMYELSVIGIFIKEHGESVAKAFYEASATEDRYDWAKACGELFEKRNHVTFSDIQRACDLNTDDWKNQYVLANKVVHASPQGTFARLGNMGTQSIIPVGRSDFGITTPGEHSAISLAVISAMFLSIYPEADALTNVSIINRWVNVVREAYFKAHDEVFPDDEPLLN